jgi:hypothetical protein
MIWVVLVVATLGLWPVIYASAPALGMSEPKSLAHMFTWRGLREDAFVLVVAFLAALYFGAMISIFYGATAS